MPEYISRPKQLYKKKICIKLVQVYNAYSGKSELKEERKILYDKNMHSFFSFPPLECKRKPASYSKIHNKAVLMTFELLMVSYSSLLALEWEQKKRSFLSYYPLKIHTTSARIRPPRKSLLPIGLMPAYIERKMRIMNTLFQHSSSLFRSILTKVTWLEELADADSLSFEGLGTFIINLKMWYCEILIQIIN